MITIQILEGKDKIQATDWIRPLTPTMNMFGDDNNIHSFSTYGGYPTNNMKWVRVSDMFGDCWIGSTVEEINNEEVFPLYEFARGDIPEEHIWDWKSEQQE